MPSLPDTAVIILIGLLLFGPKGLAQIARQLGKLMGEFRRASNEFRMQMEEELRIAEQADRQKEIAKIEAAAPPAPAMQATPAETLPEGHTEAPQAEPVAVAESAPEPLPIASSGDLSIMPPATGLPQPRSSSHVSESSSLATLIDAVPKIEPPDSQHPATNGDAMISHPAEGQRPMRYTNNDSTNGTGHHAAPEESLHG